MQKLNHKAPIAVDEQLIDLFYFINDDERNTKSNKENNRAI